MQVCTFHFSFRKLKLLSKNNSFMIPCSMEKSLEIDRLGNELQSAHAVSKQSQEVRIISLVYSKVVLHSNL